MIRVNEMTIVQWERKRTESTKRNLERIKAIMGFGLPTS